MAIKGGGKQQRGVQKIRERKFRQEQERERQAREIVF